MPRKVTHLCVALLLSIVLLSSTAWVAHGQIEVTKGELSAYVGVTSPSGDFGDDGGTIANGNGYAMLGLSLTGEYTWPVGPEGLGWVSGASLIVNRFDGDEAFEGADDDVDIKSGYWLNVPVMTGLKYQTEVSPTMDLYGLGQVGVNLNKGPSTEIEDDFGNSADISYGTATSLGFSIGTGVVINEQFNVRLRYLRLGEPELEIEVESGNFSDEDDYDQPLSMLQLVVGISITPGN